MRFAPMPVASLRVAWVVSLLAPCSDGLVRELSGDDTGGSPGEASATSASGGSACASVGCGPEQCNATCSNGAVAPTRQCPGSCA